MDQKGKKFARKKPLAGCVACMAIYRPTPDLKGRTFKLCILIRWDFNFCVRSSSLRGRGERKKDKYRAKEKGEKQKVEVEWVYRRR